MHYGLAKSANQNSPEQSQTTLRQPRGKLMVPFVNSHEHATRIGWYLWDIDLRFAPGLPPGWLSKSISCFANLPLNPQTSPRRSPSSCKCLQNVILQRGLYALIHHKKIHHMRVASRSLNHKRTLYALNMFIQLDDAHTYLKPQHLHARVVSQLASSEYSTPHGSRHPTRHTLQGYLANKKPTPPRTLQ